jgi:hypothetical protein
MSKVFRYLRIANHEIESRAMKGQDVLVLLARLAHPDREWTYPALATALSISVSEAHAATRRLVEAGLLENAESRRGPRSKSLGTLTDFRGPTEGNHRPRREAAKEFLIHGFKYVFPCRPGTWLQGVPTAHSAEPLSKSISSAETDAYVWPSARGSMRGLAIAPVYRSAPEAALQDPKLHRLLALLDGVRVGRARERALAVTALTSELKDESASS